jgi:4-amino-4-deoxy-L-arabinose transferase-like glycosyltransferase
MSRRDQIALGVTVLVAFLLRLWWAGALTHNPPLSDPDGYGDMSRALVGADGWHWTPRAVKFAEFTKAPLYQVMLSGVWRVTSVVPFVNTALVLHALINALTPVALYIIGTRLHNRRAGLIAAAAYGVWLANIMPTDTLWQEQLFIPAACWAMAVMSVAFDRREPRWWVAAGAAFGIAALTRSSIAYFVVPAAVLVAVSAPSRKAALREAAPLLIGFAVIVVPYVLYISAATGRPMFIENIGFFSLKRFNAVSPVDPRINLLTMMQDPSGPPTAGEVLRFLWRDFAASPGAFLERRLDVVRLLLKPGGASLLANQFASTAAYASLLRVAVFAALDIPFMVVVVLAPIGAALAKCRRLAVILALWPPMHLCLVALMIWAGTRFRAPVEPALLTLAAVVAAGEWRRPGRLAGSLAVTATLVLAAFVAASWPSIVTARANYGIETGPSLDADVRFVGSMGAYVSSTGKALAIALRSDAPADVTVFVDGKKADVFTLGGTAERQYMFDAPKRVYLEVTATSGGHPAATVLRLK